MSFRLKDLLDIISLLKDRNFDFILIGSSVFSLYRKKNEFEGDIDLFGVSPDPLIQEDDYYELAEKMGWEIEKTWVDTPAFIVPSGIKIDFYSNFMEFEFPLEFLDDLKEWRISGIVFKSVNLEQAVLLKVRGALINDSHREDLKAVLSDKRLVIKKEAISKYLQFFSDDTSAVMRRVLSEIGLSVD